MSHPSSCCCQHSHSDWYTLLTIHKPRLSIIIALSRAHEGSSLQFLYSGDLVRCMYDTRSSLQQHLGHHSLLFGLSVLRLLTLPFLCAPQPLICFMSLWLPFPECCMVGIIQQTLTTLSVFSSYCVFSWINEHLFLVLNSIPLSGYATAYLPTYWRTSLLPPTLGLRIKAAINICF